MENEKPLASWKEISAHLNCSLRTCQRWETELHLPIHRLDGTPKARVFAYGSELDRWLEQTLHHGVRLKEHQNAARARWKKRLFASAIGCLVLAAGSLPVWRKIVLPPLEIAGPKPILAVLPFENATGEASWEDWRTALPDLIVTDLTQSRAVNVIRITDLHRAVIGLQPGRADRFSDLDLKNIAAKTGMDRAIAGSILKEGGETIAAVSIINPADGERLGTFRATLPGENGIFAAADDLTLGIKKILHPSEKRLRRDMDKDVRRISTSFPQAFKLYGQALREWGSGRNPEAIALLQQAVDIDPEFALAYKYLWRACMNARRSDDEKKYIRRAVEFAGRLSERERGDMAVLFYRNYEKSPGREMKALERLCRFHPDDRFGGIQLMELFYEREEWSRALAVAERGMAANPKEVIFITGIARCSENLGRGEEAIEALSAFIDKNPDHIYWIDAVRLRSECLKLQGRYEEALRDVATIAARFPNRRSGFGASQAAVLAWRGDLEGAEAELFRALERDDLRHRIEDLLILHDVRLLQGRNQEAAAFLRQATEISRQAKTDDLLVLSKIIAIEYAMADLHRNSGELPEALVDIDQAIQDQARRFGAGPPFESLHLKGLILLEMNRIEEFDGLVDELRAMTEKGQNPKRMKHYFHLLGSREFKRGENKRAIEFFWKAVDLLSIPGSGLEGADARYLFSLGDALEKYAPSSAFQAMKIFDKALETTVDRLHAGSLFARSFYRSAKIHEAICRDISATSAEVQSHRSKAIERYRNFLELWKNADPDFGAEIRDARNRLAALLPD